MYKTHRPIVLGIRLSEGQYAELRSEAEAQQESLASIVRRACSAYIWQERQRRERMEEAAARSSEAQMEGC